MDKVRLVLYANGKIVRKDDGIGYDRRATAVVSVLRDLSYEQQIAVVCRRLKIDRMMHRVEFLQRVAVREGNNLYFDVVSVGDDDAVEELLSSQGSPALYVQIFENGQAAAGMLDIGGGNIERNEMQVYESQVLPETEGAGSN